MNIVEWYGKIILEYGKHLQECTGNLAIKFAFFLFLIVTNHAMCWCSFLFIKFTTTVKVGWKTVFYAKRLSIFQLKLIIIVLCFLRYTCFAWSKHWKSYNCELLLITFPLISDSFSVTLHSILIVQNWALFALPSGKLTLKSNSIWVS